MGWQSYPFLVTPKELRTACEPFKLVVDNTCVPIDYTDTPIEDFLKNYSLLYELLIGGEVLNGKTHGKLLKQIAITTNLSAVKFSRGHELDGKMVKSVIFDKSISPMPYLSPFTFVTYCENDKINVSTRASYMMYTDVVFGYEISFCKFSQSDVDYYGLSSEKEFKTYPDYELFKKSIAKITKPLRFRLNGIVKKTSIRISDEVKMHLPNLYCIKSNGIEIL
ncbi:MAG: hypothetical protein HDQ98_01460 [Lachnospiraceae bacterium]|nr:hypothetical protein [Lachnospiraceae bacterium]